MATPWPTREAPRRGGGGRLDRTGPGPAVPGTPFGRGVAEETLQQIDEAAAAEVQVAVDQAKQAPRPDVATLETDVWADGGAAWHN